MEITYPSDNGVIASYGMSDGYTSPFDVRHIKKTAKAVKKANFTLKKRKAERFNKLLQEK